MHPTISLCLPLFSYTEKICLCFTLIIPRDRHSSIYYSKGIQSIINCRTCQIDRTLRWTPCWLSPKTTLSARSKPSSSGQTRIVQTAIPKDHLRLSCSWAQSHTHIHPFHYCTKPPPSSPPPPTQAPYSLFSSPFYSRRSSSILGFKNAAPVLPFLDGTLGCVSDGSRWLCWVRLWFWVGAWIVGRGGRV